MKKRSFLLPLAGAVAVLAASSSIVTATPVALTMASVATLTVDVAAPTPVKPLVLQRATGSKMAQWHGSHASHASHASHRSHYSSR